MESIIKDIKGEDFYEKIRQKAKEETEKALKQAREYYKKHGDNR